MMVLYQAQQEEELDLIMEVLHFGTEVIALYNIPKDI
jgi:hypothetical protein